MLDALLLVMEVAALLAMVWMVATPCDPPFEPVKVTLNLARTPLRWTSGFL
jgi:hypothetical protein